MKVKLYFAITAIALVIGFIKIKSRGDYRYTINRQHNLYVEVYNSGIIGNLTSEYLTDSVNFRVYLGTFDDENGYIYCKQNGDKIYIEKREHGSGASPQWDTLKVVKRKTFSLKELKKRHDFE
jgi:hypothetical protein